MLTVRRSGAITLVHGSPLDAEFQVSDSSSDSLFPLY